MTAPMNRLFRRLAGGCHLNRPISQLVADCGLELTQMDNYYMEGAKPFGYMFEGRAGQSRHKRRPQYGCIG